MHPSISKLHKLVNHLAGQDLAQMSSKQEAEFRAGTTDAFKEATAGLSDLLLGKYSGDPRWLWKAEEANSFGGEWIATFSIIDTGQIEAAVGKHEKIQLGAALFPCLSLTVDLFAEYHHPGGTGLQVDPKVSITVEASGDPEFELVQHYLELSAEFFPNSEKGISVEVVPLENCCDEIVNPANIVESYSHVTAAARATAIRENGDASLAEAVQLILSFDASVDPEMVEEAFEYIGLMFASVLVAQK